MLKISKKRDKKNGVSLISSKDQFKQKHYSSALSHYLLHSATVLDSVQNYRKHVVFVFVFTLHLFLSLLNGSFITNFQQN